MGIRLTWRQICRSDEYQGRWVALDNCRCDPVTAAPLEGDVVDADEDLADLCGRMRQADRSRCRILFCEDDERVAPPRRVTSPGLGVGR